MTDQPTRAAAPGGAAVPRVSVVIASNRGGPYLAEALASVRAQTTPVHEVILVDDGSPEPGLSTWAADGVTVLRQAPSGVSTARNLGVAHAGGDWIALLDDDDVWYPAKIERQLQAIAASPAAIACYSDLAIIDAEGSLVSEVIAPVGDSAELISRGNGVPPINTLLVRREAYQAVGGCDPRLAYAEDIDLVLRLLQAGSFTKAPDVLIGYRKYPGQTTSDGFASLGGYLDVVRAQMDSARGRGDAATAALLRAHLRRTRPGAADWGARELLSRVRHRRWRDAAAVARWGLGRTGASFVPALVRTLSRRLTSTPR